MLEDRLGEQVSLGRQARLQLKAKGLKAKKSLGQHFLVDRRALARIADAALLEPDDTVIEVGPGLGVLTREIGRRAGRVISVEIDSGLAGMLSSDPATGNNITVVNADILQTSPVSLLPSGVEEYKVVANLPYYITGAVLRHFLESAMQPRLMVIMVQKEVARSITAMPGQMSLLSIGVQLFGKAEIVTSVPAKSFHPVPKVDSAVVRVTAYSSQLIEPEYRQGFFRLARAGFGSPRKQLINTLSHGLDLNKDTVAEIMQKADIDYRRRAESLSVEEWLNLFRHTRQQGVELC